MQLVLVYYLIYFKDSMEVVGCVLPNIENLPNNISYKNRKIMDTKQV
jgi:uncharacterized protein (DUF608 family)